MGKEEAQLVDYELTMYRESFANMKQSRNVRTELNSLQGKQR